MKIAHECPLSIFDQVQTLTDIDYALVHLFEESEAYYKKFKQSVHVGREVILDNSIFELGEAFDTKKYREWIKKLQPTWYIIPDVLENSTRTMANVRDWDFNIPGKSIGVVQGRDFNDIVRCYNFLVDKVDMLAISFDYSYYTTLYDESFTKNKWQSYMLGRKSLIDQMEALNIINKDKPHHLLGCSLPQEFSHYRPKEWIYSVDTSNPVIHGMRGIKYKNYGLDDKESTKLFTLIDEAEVDYDTVKYNIQAFRNLANGAGLINVDQLSQSKR